MHRQLYEGTEGRRQGAESRPLTAKRRTLARAAMLVAGLTAVSSVLGFARDVVIAAEFGAGRDLDAFFVAQGLMNVVLGVLGGALAKASIPVLARQAAAPHAVATVSRTVSVAASVLLLVLGSASLVMALIAGPMVHVLAPGFAGDQADLARDLTRLVLIATVLIASTNLLAGVAQAHGIFFWGSVQGIPFNVVMITAAVVFGPRYGVVALAVGYVVGTAGRLACQLVPLRRLRLRLRWSLDLSDRGARELGLLLPPLLLGSAVTNVNALVDRAVGSTLGAGVISALSYSWRLVGLVDAVLVASLVTVLYPAFGTAAAGPRDALARLVDRSLASVTALLLPVTAILLVTAVPVVVVVYRRGAFDESAAHATAVALLWYAPSLVAIGWREVVMRASFAIGDTRTPVMVSVLAMMVNVVGDLTLGRALGIPGLAASTTFSVIVAATLNTWLLVRRHDAVCLQGVAGLLARCGCGAGAAAVVAAWIVVSADATSVETGTLRAAVTLAVAGVAGLLACWLCWVVIRAPERQLVKETVSSMWRQAPRG
jgi:putative peptidoglycan lipid II flippase